MNYIDTSIWKVFYGRKWNYSINDNTFANIA